MRPLCYFDLVHPAKLPREKLTRGFSRFALRDASVLRRFAPPAGLTQVTKTSDQVWEQPGRANRWTVLRDRYFAGVTHGRPIGMAEMN